MCSSTGLAANPLVHSRLAGHALAKVLIAQGVHTCFGVPVEGYLAVLDGFREHRGHICFFACRHEDGAAFMADAQGRIPGRPGVCFVTCSPGATNASIGVHRALQDCTPKVLFIGKVASDQRDRKAFQVVDHRRVLSPEHSAWPSRWPKSTAPTACLNSWRTPFTPRDAGPPRPGGADAA